MAIVVTKTDALNKIEKNTLPFSSNQVMNIESISQIVRQWFIDRDEGNLVRNIENDFHDISYFQCSSLGHSPGKGKPFTPKGVILPLEHLLKKKQVRIRGKAKTGFSLKSEITATIIAVIIAIIGLGSILFGFYWLIGSLFFS